jgi:integration host factor subunit beta
MIMSELVQRISEQYPCLYRRDAERILNAVLDQIVDALTRQDRVEIRGFARFPSEPGRRA